MAEKDEPSLELPAFSLKRRERDAPVVVEEVAVRPPRAPRRHLPAPLAAGVAGLVVGVVAVGLVWAAGQGLCETMSGTTSCGGGPGLLLLVLVVVVLALLGAALLRGLAVDHPGSTSTLAVGVAVVVTLLLFADVLLERSGAALVVATTLAAFVAAQALTAASGGGD